MSAGEPAGFDFLIGEWRVRNLRLGTLLTDGVSPERWTEFPSTMQARRILGGRGVAETYAFADFPGRGELHGFVLRLVAATGDRWRIWWTSSASPGDLDPPLRGGFVDGDGFFEGEDSYDGRSVLVRTRYFDIGPQSFRWAQSFSFDGGRTYRIDWIMEFLRTG